MKDILSVITAYREERGWTEYQLAECSGLPQSTISSWYRKNMVPTIPSLEKICTAFDITMSQLFADGDAPGKPGWQNTTPVFPFCDGGDGRNGARSTPQNTVATVASVALYPITSNAGASTTM